MGTLLRQTFKCSENHVINYRMFDICEFTSHGIMTFKNDEETSGEEKLSAALKLTM